MAVEIERKFLVVGAQWRATPGVVYRQGYLCREPNRTVRVRIAGDKSYLAVKGESTGMSRLECEYEIPRDDAERLLELCDRPLIEKLRRVVDYAGTRWEIDEFLGDNAGLVVAEVELDREDQAFALPPWIGNEVTGDPRYINANLTANPFSLWRDREASQPRA